MKYCFKKISGCYRCVNMNELIEKNLGEDKNMEFRKNDIELINKYRDSDNLFIYLNKNKPIFTDEDKKQLEEKTDPFSDLDKLERCGVAFTCIVGKKLNSSSGNQKFKSRIKPTAWKSSLQRKSQAEICEL